VRSPEAFRAHDGAHASRRNAEALRSFGDKRAESRIKRIMRDALDRL